jgi:hypothetical protein
LLCEAPTTRRVVDEHANMRRKVPRSKSSVSSPHTFADPVMRTKTQFCQFWDPLRPDSSCAAGARCTFAHGRQDLDPAMDATKFKTAPCRNWNAERPHSSCPYGARCWFIHGNDPVYVSESPSRALTLLREAWELVRPCTLEAVEKDVLCCRSCMVLS